MDEGHLYRAASLTRDISSPHGRMFNTWDFLPDSDAERSLEIWIKEALVLESSGMPAGSFTLIFDDNGIPDRSFEVLDSTVLRKAAWQEALDRKLA